MCKSAREAKQRQQKNVYKNSRRPVACVEGLSAPSMEWPKGFLVHCNQVKLGRNDGCIVLKWLQVAYEWLQPRFDQRRLYHNSKPCSIRIHVALLKLCIARCLMVTSTTPITSPVSLHIVLLYNDFFLLPPSANFTNRGSLAPCRAFPLNICIICSHFSLDSILKQRYGVRNVRGILNNSSAMLRANANSANLANPTPLLCPAVSRNMRVEITCPYWASKPSTSFSLKLSGRFAMYKFVGSCSCCWEESKNTMQLIVVDSRTCVYVFI